MSIRTDFPKGTVVSWRDTQDRRMGTVIGYDVINATGRDPMTLVMVKTGNVIQHPDPDALFVEAPKVGINDLLCQHGFTGEQFLMKLIVAAAFTALTVSAWSPPSTLRLAP